MHDEQMTVHVMELRESIAALQQDVKAAFKRIDEHTKLVDAVHKLALSVQEHTSELKILREQQTTIRADLEELKAKPAKRWDALIGAGIAAVVGALVGWLAGR